MKIIKANKCITEIVNGISDGFGIVLSVEWSDGSKEVASFEENEERQVRLSSPMKWMRRSGEQKERICSFSENEVTKELIDKISALEDIFMSSSADVKRLYS